MPRDWPKIFVYPIPVLTEHPHPNFNAPSHIVDALPLFSYLPYPCLHAEMDSKEEKFEAAILRRV
jgi:hypothetical protein